VSPGSRVLIAVSGGADSVALLHLFAREAPARSLHLAVAHFDHRLRAGSAADRQFVEGLAAALGLPCAAGAGDVRALARAERRSLEDAARRARHRFLEQARRETGSDLLALAHQQDDLCEGVLMRLIEGSGTAGLAGMRPRSGVLVRPLLGVPRAAIRTWAEAEGLAWREDPTNASLAPRRNRIRALLLPLLEREFNPRVREAIGRGAGTLALEDELLGGWAGDWLRDHAAPSGERSLFLPRSALLRLPEGLRRRVLFGALRQIGLSPRRIRERQIAGILELLAHRRTGARVSLAGLTARVERDGLRLLPADPGGTIRASGSKMECAPRREV